MKKLYMILALAFGASLSAEAVERPKTPAGAPEDGGKYILVNAYNPAAYMSRTSWDGALYFLGKDDSKYASHAFTAQKNEDDTWSFFVSVPLVEENEETGKMDTVSYEPNYLVMNSGSGNVNMNTAEQTKWSVTDGDLEGFYHLVAGEGNCEDFHGLKLHLNSGSQYFVISEPNNGGQWYPDYAGGATETTDNDFGWIVDETGRALMNDSTSENWAFIKVEDVPAHMAFYEVYNAIDRLENDYLGIEGFENGFQLTYDAVVAIYKAEGFDPIAEKSLILEMINSKIALYDEILGTDLIEEHDAFLTAAIEEAMISFNTKYVAADLETAKETLVTAINTFKEGTGDFTSLGVNMSFEDLSAQNGATTTGLAAPPYGWTVIVAGDTVRTADDVKNHGIANWHGANNECTGTEKDGNYGFGLWTAGVPEYQISQTITGLENGTYVIKAVLMVGANGSGSRRTTQRIFGNLNSTYFASEYEYDLSLLDKSEFYAFQGNVEPVTDTEMLPMEVRAYVYDGTLTFGLRTNGNTDAAMVGSNSGAGWFKIDNFRIQKEGYIGEDAAAVANYYRNTVDELTQEKMEGQLMDEMMIILDNCAEVTAEDEPETINALITTFKDCIPSLQASIAAYARLYTAIEEAYLKAEGYESYVGFNDYLDIIDKASTGYDEGIYSTEEIETVIASFATAFVDLQLSGSAVGDYMDIILNPSFEDLSNQNNTGSSGPANAPAGWTLTINGVECKTTADYSAAGAAMNWCAINNGDAINAYDEQGVNWTNQYTDGDHLWGIWADNMPEVELSQSFTGIPKGTYILSCDLICPFDAWSGDGVTTQRIFANSYVQMYTTEENYVDALNITEDMAEAMAFDASNPDADLKHMNYAGYVNTVAGDDGSSRCPHPMSLKFGVDESGLMKIGFRTNNVDFDGTVHPRQGAGWFKLDNFKLFYESEEIPTSIGDIKVSDKLIEVVDQKYYTIDGREIAQPQKGVNIVKTIMSDGSVKAVKVLK